MAMKKKRGVQCLASASMHLLIWLAVSVVGKTEITSLSGWVILSHNKIGRGQDCRFTSPVRGELPPRPASAPGQIATPFSPAPPHAVCAEQQRSVKMLCATSPGEAADSGVSLMLVGQGTSNGV